MMDEQVVRQQLAEVQTQLSRNEEERTILLDLVHGLEGWLRLGGFGVNAQGSFPRLADIVDGTYAARGPQPKGTMSFRSGVTKVLDDAHGAPLHAKEIARRILELGVVTSARDIPGIVDLTCKNIVGAEKVAPRTWRKIA